MFDFEDADEDSRPGLRICGSIEGLRDQVLSMFGGFVAHVSGHKEIAQPNALEYQRQFLELWEVESIVKELSDIGDDGCYGIGANSFEEYRAKMLKLFRTLAARVMSNIMHEGVKRGLLDAEYDFERGDFAFSLTERGTAVARANKISTSDNAENDADI